MDDMTVAHLTLILAYLWSDESNDYIDNPSVDHIYVSLIALRNHLGLQDEYPDID